jgi:hypothetical protein
MFNKKISLDKATVWEWMDHGVKQGWITEPFCYTHDGDPYMTDEESEEWEQGGDPCFPVTKFLI